MNDLNSVSQLLFIFMTHLNFDFHLDPTQRKNEIVLTKNEVVFSYTEDLNFKSHFEEVFNFWLGYMAKKNDPSVTQIPQFSPEHVEHGLRSLKFQCPLGITGERQTIMSADLIEEVEKSNIN